MLYYAGKFMDNAGAWSLMHISGFQNSIASDYLAASIPEELPGQREE
jgi:hypothetical protein